jgi:copper chaperone
VEPTRTYRVAGMSCAHCTRAVAAEVGGVAGVTGVEVDLGAGLLTVMGHDVQDAAVAAAVAEAGYEVVS